MTGGGSIYFIRDEGSMAQAAATKCNARMVGLQGFEPRTKGL
jgi:hypothetical protein